MPSFPAGRMPNGGEAPADSAWKGLCDAATGGQVDRMEGRGKEEEESRSPLPLSVGRTHTPTYLPISLLE